MRAFLLVTISSAQAAIIFPDDDGTIARQVVAEITDAYSAVLAEGSIMRARAASDERESADGNASGRASNEADHRTDPTIPKTAAGLWNRLLGAVRN